MWPLLLFLLLFFIWSMLGLFHACNFAKTKGKNAISVYLKQRMVPENCVKGGKTRLQGHMFLQGSTVRDFLLYCPHCSLNTPLHSTHTRTQCLTRAVVDEPWEKERKRYCDDWLCSSTDWPWATVFSCYSNRKNSENWEDVRTFAFKANPCADLQITHAVSLKHANLSWAKKQQRHTAYTG